VLEEIEESKAFYQVYDGAVYLHQGRTYLCRKLDLDARVALVRPADLKYYTKPVDFTDVHVVGGRNAFLPDPAPAAPAPAPAPEQQTPAPAPEQQAPLLPGTSAACGRALVTTRWLGFVRCWRGSGQVFDRVDLWLPDVQYETEAAYMRLPPSARGVVEAAGLPFRAGVHAAAHALLNVLPLLLMCNAGDVGTGAPQAGGARAASLAFWGWCPRVSHRPALTVHVPLRAECDNPYDTRYKPERLLLYDKHPGGIGLAAAVSGGPLALTLAATLHVAEPLTTPRPAGPPAVLRAPAARAGAGFGLRVRGRRRVPRVRAAHQVRGVQLGAAQGRGEGGVGGGAAGGGGAARVRPRPGKPRKPRPRPAPHRHGHDAWF
jgi:DEAD/DEAH box helicase domain-containing protein